MQRFGQISVHPSAADRGGEEARGRGSIPCRAFTSLLKLSGLSALPGWSGLLWSAALYGLQTGMTYRLLRMLVNSFIQLRNAQTPVFGALFASHFVAIPNVVQWAALTATFACGRKRYAILLPQVHAVLADIDKFPKLAKKRSTSHHAGECMWALVSAIVVIYIAYVSTDVVSSCRERGILACAKKVGVIIAYGYSYIALQLVAMKFLFAGLMLNSGFGAINNELEAVIADGCGEVYLRQIGRLQKQLSNVFSRLSTSMTAELVFVMTYGIMEQVVVALMLASPSSLTVTSVPLLLLFLSAAAVCLVGPCEISQMLLDRLGRQRDLLLELEWQQPQLAGTTQQMQKAVARDLETFGDLSFFSMRRSTLLGITSTILTYIIVMAQFHMSER